MLSTCGKRLRQESPLSFQISNFYRYTYVPEMNRKAQNQTINKGQKRVEHGTFRQ